MRIWTGGPRSRAVSPTRAHIYRRNLSTRVATARRRTGGRGPIGATGRALEVDHSLYQGIVENALAATGSVLVSLAELDPEAKSLTTVAHIAESTSRYARAKAAARHILPGFDPNDLRVSVSANPIVRAVHLEGKTVLARFEEITQGTAPPAILRIASTVLGVRYVLSVPMRADGEILGSLGFVFASEPADSVQRAAEAFARQASLTWQNAQLAAALRHGLEELRNAQAQAIAAEERTRGQIAELLHGRVQSRLLVAWSQLRTVEELWQSDPAQAVALLAAVRDEIDRVREQEIRQASYRLHPSFIRQGLALAIDELIGRFEQRLAFTVEANAAFTAWDTPVRNRIPAPLRLAAFRVIEEAVGNVLRYARATTIYIWLGIDSEEQLAISVRDNGCGFDGAQARAGLGLGSIHSRVSQAGGSWHITSHPGEGTTISALLPLRAHELAREMSIMAASWRQAGFDIKEAVWPAAQGRDAQLRNTNPGLSTTSGPAGEATLVEHNSVEIPRPQNRWTGANRGGWSAPEFDRLVDALHATLDRDERIRLLVQMARIYTGDAAVISLYFNPTVTAFVAGLRGPQPVVPTSTVAWNIHRWEFR